MSIHGTKEIAQQIAEIAQMPDPACAASALINRIGVELFCVLLRRDAAVTLKLHTALDTTNKLLYDIQYAAAYAQAVYERDGALNALADISWHDRTYALGYEVSFAFVYDYMYCFIRAPGVSKEYILLIDHNTPVAAYAQPQVRAFLVR